MLELRLSMNFDDQVSYTIFLSTAVFCGHKRESNFLMSNIQYSVCDLISYLLFTVYFNICIIIIINFLLGFSIAGICVLHKH